MPPTKPVRHLGLRHRLLRDWTGGAAGALLAIAFGLFFLHTRFGEAFTRTSYDLPFVFRPATTPEGAVIVYLDEESYRQLGQQYNRWDRALHARLIDALKAAGARMIVFDVFFAGTAVPASDLALARAIRSHAHVILGAELEESKQSTAAFKTILLPPALLGTNAVGWGLVKVLKDPDFSVRQHYPGNGNQLSLSWKAAEHTGIDVATASQRSWVNRWVNYYGPSGTVPSISYYRVLARDSAIPPDFFRNKAVFVGARPLAGYAGEQKDEFRNPFTWANREFSPGVEIHALCYLNLVRHDWLTAIPSLLETLLITLAGAGAGYGLTRLRPLTAILTAVGTMLGVTLLAFLLFWWFRLWFSWVLLAGIQIPVALAWTLGINTFRLYLDKRLLQHSLSLHVSPARVRQLLKHPNLRRPGGEQQTISILFSDITDFSTITARMDADDLFRLLNKYFDSSLNCIHRHQGTVIKLLGDGIFAIWNAPVAQPDHQRLACQAALELRQQLIQFDERQASLPLRTRVGLHTGLACVGNVGSQTRFDYSAIGESVNLSSRLEGLNKFLGTEILATRDIQKAVENLVPSRPVGHFRLKGFDEVVEVHELVAAPAELLSGFRTALKHFQRREFDPAAEAFQAVLAQHPQDGPTRFYLNQIALLRDKTLPGNWYGEIDLKEK